MNAAKKFSSIYWIILLLAALFLGPIFVQRDRSVSDRRAFGIDASTDFRDAPASRR